PGERRFSTAGRCFATLASSSTWVAHGCGSRGTPRSCPSTRTRASAGHWTKCLPGNTQATARATSPGTRSCRRSGARILAACSSAMAARRGCAACDRLSRAPSPLRDAPRRLRQLRQVLERLDRPRRTPDDRGGGRGCAGGGERGDAEVGGGRQLATRAARDRQLEALAREGRRARARGWAAARWLPNGHEKQPDRPDRTARVTRATMCDASEDRETVKAGCARSTCSNPVGVANNYDYLRSGFGVTARTLPKLSRSIAVRFRSRVVWKERCGVAIDF